MKRLSFLLLVITFLTIIISSCTKDNEIGLGEPNLSFGTDSIYQASTDGFLFVEIVNYGNEYAVGQATAKVYADDTPDPTTEIGTIHYSITLPINNGMYWKVTRLVANSSFKVIWTPIE
jgi:hypothetical protein